MDTFIIVDNDNKYRTWYNVTGNTFKEALTTKLKESPEYFGCDPDEMLERDFELIDDQWILNDNDINELVNEHILMFEISYYLILQIDHKTKKVREIGCR
jgi:hypothetical protein